MSQVIDIVITPIFCVTFPKKAPGEDESSYTYDAFIRELATIPDQELNKFRLALLSEIDHSIECNNSKLTSIEEIAKNHLIIGPSSWFVLALSGVMFAIGFFALLTSVISSLFLIFPSLAVSLLPVAVLFSVTPVGLAIMLVGGILVTIAAIITPILFSTFLIKAV